MLEDLESEHPPNIFHGVRFILCGFDPISKSQVYNKLVQGGAVDVGQYGPRVTHVVVDNLTYDDPVCVAAREDGKILVNGLWVGHSFDAGMSADHANVMYRPLRDLKGIPGAKSLVVCLTGYQRQDRDDIMAMVSLMGANFSKPLVANKVTHLICYKFEGDKYELAKRTNRIKLVNHLWLEDCLKAWELLPEAGYNKSGYELEELEAEAKDSEEETDISIKRSKLLNPRQEFKIEQLASSSLKGLPTVINTNSIASAKRNDSISHPDPNAPEIRIKESEVLDSRGPEAFGNASCGKPLKSLDRTAGPETVGIGTASTSRNERFARSDASILNFKSYDGESPKRTTSSMYTGDVTGELSTAQMVTATDGVDIINEHLKGENAVGCFRTPTTPVLRQEEQCSKINENRTCRAQKTDHSSAAQVSVLSPEMNRSDTFKAASAVGGSNEIRRAPACTTPILENSTTDIRNGSDLTKAFLTTLMGSEKDKRVINNEKEYVANRQESVASEVLKTAPLRRSEYKKSNVCPKLSLNADARVKPPTQMSGRKSWSKSGASSQKGSIYLSKSVAEDDPVISLNAGEKTKSNEMIEMVPTGIDLNADLGNAAHDDLQPERELQYNPMSMDDETEAPEENGVNDQREVVVHEKIVEGKSDITREDDKYPQRQKGSSDIETSGEEKDGAKEKKNASGIRKLGKSASSQNKRFREQKDEAEQGEAICSKRKMIKMKKTAQPSEASEVDGGNEFLKAVEGENLGDIEPGSPENYEEDKLKEAQPNDSDHHAIRMHSRKTSGVNKGGSRQKKATCGKRKLVESSHLENTVNDEKKTLKKAPLRTNKKVVPSISKRTNSKEATNEDAEKEMTEDNITHPTGEIKNANQLDKPVEQEKENRPVRAVDQNSGHGKKVQNLASTKGVNKIGTGGYTPNLNTVELQKKPKTEPVRFILSGHKLQRKEFQQVIRKLNGKVCKDSHNWSYQATHFIVPEPIRRTEKFFAAAASGRWILKTDYLSDSSRAGKFLAEEPYEWYKSGSSEDDAINLEAPRKWRLQRERTGHGAFYGMNIIIYGECITPSLDTLKRVLKAGEGTILATSPPYTRFLGSGVDFAVVSPGMPRVDIWVQDFFKHEIPCISADYLVDFVCKPGYSLDKHVLYDTYAWAEKALKKVVSQSEENAELATPPRDGGESPVPCEEVTTPMNPDENDLPCQVCGSRDRGEEMLICGNESHTKGCGIGTHIDCCDPPLLDIPKEDWFCPKCSKKPSKKKTRAAKTK
ncbi:hypothetical protein AgCh_036154 [Apium graveolens]